MKYYNLNETEVLDSDFKNAFSRNFQFHRRDPSYNSGPNLIGSSINLKTIFSIQMSSSFFSCDDTGFFHEDRFHEDLVYLLYVLTTMMSSYCAKLCVRINVQLFGFYIPTIIGSIMSFLLSGSGSSKSNGFKPGFLLDWIKT